jgi:TATA-binding protein-associated factor Taf7
MRTRSIAAAATVGALALGGAAIAAADGAGPFGGGPGVSEAEFAGDLAEKLDGVSAGEVQRALREVREERHGEHRREVAAGLAEELDVSRADAEAALEKAEARGPRDFLGTLASELGKTRREVRSAFAAMARKRFDAMLDRAVEEGHLTEEQAERARERFREGPRGFHRHGFVAPGGPPEFRHELGRPGRPAGRGDSVPVPPPFLLPPPR